MQHGTQNLATEYSIGAADSQPDRSIYHERQPKAHRCVGHHKAMERVVKYLNVPGAAVLCLLLTAACSQNVGRTYPAGSVGTSMHVSHGKIVAIEAVTVEGRASVVGTLGGAAVGNSIGRTVGGGSGKRVAGAVGAVAGAVAGRALEKQATSTEAVEIIVKLDSGRTIAVIQEDDPALRPGDRVRIIKGRQTSRVVPI